MSSAGSAPSTPSSGGGGGSSRPLPAAEPVDFVSAYSHVLNALLVVMVRAFKVADPSRRSRDPAVLLVWNNLVRVGYIAVDFLLGDTPALADTATRVAAALAAGGEAAAAVVASQ